MFKKMREIAKTRPAGNCKNIAIDSCIRLRISCMSITLKSLSSPSLIWWRCCSICVIWSLAVLTTLVLAAWTTMVCTGCPCGVVSIPNLDCMVERGIMMKLSALPPMNPPRGSKMPITSNLRPPTRNVSPMGLTVPKRSVAAYAPSMHTLASLCSSWSLKKLPLATL